MFHDLKHLLSKHETLSSNPSAQKSKAKQTKNQFCMCCSIVFWHLELQEKKLRSA
jgi:hypothetical protein